MFKALLCWLMLLGITIGGPAHAQAWGSSQGQNQGVGVPGTENTVILNLPELPHPAGPPGQALLTEIETWISSQFDLPAIQEYPVIEFLPPVEMARLRSTGSLLDPGAQTSPNDRGSPAQYDTVAVYHDATRTVYLPEGWTDGRPAELSVLVHEMMHHFQNVLRLKYECPQEREKLAYLAQERWLGLFGRSLESDFDLDPFSLLVKTKCFY